MIYREEVLTIMGVVGDIRADVQAIRRILEDGDAEEEEEDS
jgi:hypothetical protein